MREDQRQWWVIAAWLGAFAGALAVDGAIAQFARDSGISAFLRASESLIFWLKAPGEMWFAMIVALALWAGHSLSWRAPLLVMSAGLVSGLSGGLKWVVGRTRPFKLFDEQGLAVLSPYQLSPFRGGLSGMLQQTNLCFPSGHVAWAFATAAAVSILLPRWRWSFYAVAILVAAERVLENAHWTSDAVVAAALGIGGVQLVRRFGHSAWARRLSGLHREEQAFDHGRHPVPLAGDPGV